MNMKKYNTLTLPGILQNSVSKFSESPAYAFVGEKPMTYKEVSKNVDAVLALLEKLDVKPGNKVGLLAANMPQWGIAYFAIASMGAVVVPMLPDFSKVEISNVIEHSEMVVMIASNGLIPKVSMVENKNLKHIISIEDFNLNDSESGIKFDSEAVPAAKYDVKDSDMATIIYTSGTTGKSKGVMLTHKNICFTADKSRTFQPVVTSDRFLSVLPLSHTYENTLGLILPMLGGACVYYLQKPPTPAILLPALKLVRPTIMLTVPLIIEKIYRNKVLPAFNDKMATRLLYKVPALRKKFNLLAGKKLMRTFGGELKFFGIGGAKLNKEVEQFLIEAKFPYAIGYGLTETSPLLAGVKVGSTKLQSTGLALEGVQLKINKPGKYTGEGEIWAKGPNVMLGYYKEPGLTKEVLTDDGWFKTGDLGLFDENNYLFIRGRSKNVIIGASGENIFPEDIESVINNFKHVVESLVIQQKGKLVAMVHFNREEIEQQFQHAKEEVSHLVDNKYDELKKELREYVNEKVNKFSKIQIVETMHEEFQKTATKKIKRFIYA
ncbi:MAG: AMP-binding protein [Bacteroidetes bacterium]|nr:AMP-binding protein [Bacteroidota bacterium]